MPPIVECVPNFSEGRNRETVEAIADAIRQVPGVKLMGAEPDKDYNRTVVTFAGAPEAVLTAALEATRVAVERIDMSLHRGEHPRLGAVDVVPFVPVSETTMEECVELARRYGRRIAEQWAIPVYLYEYAATSPRRKNLADIRKGEYERLPEKLREPDGKPDFGPAEFNPRSGATVTGARKFLIAYNVNLATPAIESARDIAERIRESGRVVRDAQGNPVRNEKGEPVRIPGLLKAVKAMGVFLERLQITQVSMNLIDYDLTPPHLAFEEVTREASRLGIRVTGSEIVGMIPLRALRMAGQFYAEGSPMPEEEYIQLAIRRLGLNRLEPFDPSLKVIEYQLV